MLADTLKTGTIYHLYWGRGNINNKTIHTVGIVDSDMVVYKWWGKHKQRWFYVVKSIEWMEQLMNGGILIEIKR